MSRSDRASRVVVDRSRAKIVAVGLVLAVIWLGLWARAGQVQLVQGRELADKARRQHVAAEMVYGERGEIQDREGRLLARTVRFNSVSARPDEVVDPAAAAVRLSKILDLRRSDVQSKLASNRNFLWLARQVDDRKAAAIREADLPGIALAAENGRLYPNNHLAGQLLGFVGYDDEGLEGLERAFDERLSPRQARYAVLRDASGRHIYLDDSGREVDVDGKPIRLTIDANIQDMAETALAKAVIENRAHAGTCLVVHVPTGEILAMANYPFFNPNIFRDQQPGNMRNRAVTDLFEPGSTIKPLVVAAALQEKVVAPNTRIDCEHGTWRYSTHTIRDTHKADVIPVREVIRYSSNIGAAKIGLQLGATRLHDYLSRLGLGKKTGLPLPGESPGMLRPASKWRPLDLAVTSFGYSIGVSALQMAKAYLCLASGGVARPLRLVQDPAQPEEQPERVFSKDVADHVLSMLVEVVEQDGTGTVARIPGMVVGGKTGTARKTAKEGGYSEEYLSSFIGLIPGDRPEYLILAMVDEPEVHYYGGVVAAPVVREVAVRTLAMTGRLPEDSKSLLAAAEKADSKLPALAAQAAASAASGSSSPDHAPSEGNIPDLRGLPLKRAVEILVQAGVVPRLEGSGTVVRGQKPAPGQPWPAETKEPLTLLLAHSQES